MLRKTLLRLLLNGPGKQRMLFSTAEKKGATINQQSNQPKQEPPIKEDKVQKPPREDEEDTEIPLQKQNRNTFGWWVYRFFFWGGFSLLSYNIYLAYYHNKKTPVQQEAGAVPYFIDAAKNIVGGLNQFTEFITQPPSKKLLADTVHPDFHPKTLVLNLTGTLIKTQYIFGKGTSIKLRPGLENLLRKLVQKYEIIIFAEEDSTFIQNSLNHVDPKHQYIQGIFGKESMVWRSGSYVKDLKYLNRDIKKIVVIDRKKQNVKIQPENVIILSQFDGSTEDKELTKLLTLLQGLAGPQINDVRKYIQKLGENPVESYYQKILEKQKKLQSKQKSGVFGIFNGNQKTSTKDDL